MQEGWVPGVCSFGSSQGMGSCWYVDIWNSHARVLIIPTIALPNGSDTRPVGRGHPHTQG